MKPAFVLLAGLALSAQAPSPEALTAHLREAAVVHLAFRQTRTLAALSRPVTSTGALVLARDLGVIWELRRPVAMTYVMGPKGLLVVAGDGRRERRSAREAPVVAQLGQVFQALVQGDLKGLGEFFTVTGTGSAAAWELTLRPRPRAEAFVKRVTLAGGRGIDRIRIEEPGGDHLELSFENLRLDEPLTEAERRLLAQD